LLPYVREEGGGWREEGREDIEKRRRYKGKKRGGPFIFFSLIFRIMWKWCREYRRYD
jgi:hypothetical protein